MGKIRVKTVKSVSRKIIQMFPDKVNSSFQDNKVKVAEVALIRSKKLRNQIAGYLVCLNKTKLMPKRPRVRPEEPEKPRDNRRDKFRGGSRRKDSRR